MDSSAHTRQREFRAQERPRKSYAMPQLERWGDIEVLTQAGRTRPGNDFMIYQDDERGSAGPTEEPGA